MQIWVCCNIRDLTHIAAEVTEWTTIGRCLDTHVTSCKQKNCILLFNVTRWKCNVVYIKGTMLHPFRLSAVRIRTLWTVDSTTTAPSTRLSATTLDVTTTTDSGLNVSNRKVCFLLLIPSIKVRALSKAVHVCVWSRSLLDCAHCLPYHFSSCLKIDFSSIS